MIADSMSETILIKRIKIKNILSHENTEITLPNGLIAFVGPNGAGKSSIIDSIFYALFATPSAAKGIRGEGKRGILRVGASDGFIEVEMNIGGRNYIVQRFVSNQKADMAYLIEIGPDNIKRTLATGVQNVINTIEKLLSVPSSDAIRYSVISRQNELTKFIDESETKRKEIILKLLGLDELEKAKEILKDILSEMSKAKTLYDERNRQLNEAKKELEHIEKELENLKKRKEQLEKEMIPLENEVSTLEKAKSALYRFEKLKQAKEILDEISKYERLESICNEITNFDLSSMASKLEIYKNAKRRADEIARQLKDEEAKLQTLLNNIRDFLHLEQAPPTNDIDAYIKIIESKIDEIREKKQLKKVEIEISEKSVNVIATSSTCPVCERPLEEHLKRSILTNIGGRIRESKKILNELDNIEATLKNYLNSLKSLKERLAELRTKMDTLSEQIEKALEEYSKYKQRGMKILEDAKLYDEFSECIELNDFGIIKTMQCLQRKAVESLKILKDRREKLEKMLNDLRTNLQTLSTELQSLQKTLIDLGIDIEKTRYEDIELKYKELNMNLQKIRSEANFIEGRLKELETTKDSLLKKIESLESDIKKLRKDVEIIGALDIIANNIMGRDGLIAKTLTKEARRLMELYTNSILNELGMDFQIRINEDFDIDVYSPLGRIDLRGLSGGESIALAIALRIAIAYTIFGKLPGFFILDEPTQFLDEERRRIVFEIIRRLSQRMPQVIVVTHDREVIDIADHVFYVYKDGNRSVVREKSAVFEEIAP